MLELAVVPELCLIRPPADTASEVLTLMADRAVAAGYAAPTFPEALLAREATFPTGLPTPVPVAIPHTDVHHILRPGLAAALLDPPVPFGEMGGSGESTVDVRVVIGLLVTEPSAQVGLLQQLVSVVQRPDWAEGLSNVDDAGALAGALNEVLGIAVEKA